MDRKKRILIGGLVVLSFLFYQAYHNTITLWSGYALEVSLETEFDPQWVISIDSSELQDYPDFSTVLESAQNEVIMVTELDVIDQVYELIDSKGYDIDHREYYLEVDDELFLVAYTKYGGMDDNPEYLHLSAIHLLLAVGLSLHLVYKRYSS